MRTLFDDERMTRDEALRLTAESIREYGRRYRHWVIAYSGGKDSSATLAVIVRLIESGQVERPASLTVLYADTRMELPPLHAAAMKTLAVLRTKGYRAEVVLPPIDERFYVYMLGRGVPPPKNRFRWCTSQIKVEPMVAAVRGARERAGEKLLMLTGVRLGESAARDQRISLSCSRDGSECGQGWFQLSTPEAVADTLAPLLHWRTCHVWDWLYLESPKDGLHTGDVAEVYGLDDDGSAMEINARTGCVGCNLTSDDHALKRLMIRPRWRYLSPLMRLRTLYRELTLPRNRLRKGAETKADGALVANPNRLGPLTMDARRHGLSVVKAIQSEVNAAADLHARPSRPGIDLINAEEEARIEELIDGNTWPQRWSGSESRGDELFEETYPDGTVQPLLFIPDEE